MTDQQALKLLDDVAGMANTNRQVHVQVQEAVQQLTKALFKKESNDDKPNDKKT